MFQTTDYNEFYLKNVNDITRIVTRHLGITVYVWNDLYSNDYLAEIVHEVFIGLVERDALNKFHNQTTFNNYIYQQIYSLLGNRQSKHENECEKAFRQAIRLDTFSGSSSDHCLMAFDDSYFEEYDNRDELICLYKKLQNCKSLTKTQKNIVELIFRFNKTKEQVKRKLKLDRKLYEKDLKKILKIYKLYKEQL